MSGRSAETVRSPQEGALKGAAGSRAGDRLAALLAGPERPAAYWVDELLRVWRDAQQEAAEAYATWGELAPGRGYPRYLAALDREQRAAEVYAEVRARALEGL